MKVAVMVRLSQGAVRSSFGRGTGVLLSFFCVALTALAGSPHVASLLPTGGQRGTELEVTFAGDRLQDAQEILCYEPGIQVAGLGEVTNKLVKARLKLAADCPLGEYHLRVRTASGLSELRTFFVGPFPAIDEMEPNNDPTNAQKVPLNCTVAGVIKNEDVDCFAVEMKKGQRLSAEVEAMRLGRSSLDARLAVLDPRGAVLADVDDTWLAMQDPFVSLVAPEDGTYVVRLREASYGGGNDCQYRLHIGSFPRPDSVFPPGGKAGEPLALTFFSEPTGAFTNELKLPERAYEKLGVYAELDSLPAPSPNWIRVSDFPNVPFMATNHDRDHAAATDLLPPLAFNGIIEKKGQEDWYRFPAHKGAALDVSVFARRLRSPMDSVLEVFDASGHSIASNDDAQGADSSLKFTPSETTNYFMRVRDTLGQGGRDFVYRVEVTPVEPGVTLKIPEVSRNDTQSRQYIVVPRGNRFVTLISAKRANFGGDLDFHIEGLPQGVTMLADTMPRNVEQMPLVFEAAADAPIGCKLLDLTATGTNGTSQVIGKFRQDAELVEGPNGASFYGTRVDKLCVAVTKEAPFKVAIVQPKVPLVQGGSMPLQIIAQRDPAFDEPIEVHMVWNPPGVSSQSEATIPKGETNVVYQLNAGGGAEERVWKIAVLGHADVEGGPVFVSSQLADLEVAAPFLTGKIETLRLNPGKTAQLTVTLQHAKPFEGKALVTLRGLPDKITAPAKEITKDDSEVLFDVTADPKCSLGSHRDLFCTVDIKENGETIAHTIAHGGILRVLPPRKAETKLASAGGR